MYETNGLRHWLRNFFTCMADEKCHYSFRQGNPPKQTPTYIYILIAGRIRYRIFFAGCDAGHKKFDDGKQMTAKTWIMGAGPLVKAPSKIERKGFQGFRYTDKIF